MTSQNEFNRLRDEVFKKLKTDDYTKLKSNPDALKKAEEAMKKTYDELKYMIGHANSLAEALGHLPLERQDMIKTTFRLQSFKVDIERQKDGSTNLLCASLEGKPLSFAPSVRKLSAENYEEDHVLLAARIVLEVFVLFLNLVGLHAGEEAGEAINLIIKILKAHDQIFGDVKEMVAAEKRGDNIGVAKAIIACMIDLFRIARSEAIDVVKVLLLDMPWYDVIISVAQVSLSVAALVAGDGIAQLAEVILWLLDASSFVRKLKQMNDFYGLSS